jgi:hypothetical protein
LLPGDVTSANLALGRLDSALTDFVIFNLLLLHLRQRKSTTSS